MIFWITGYSGAGKSTLANTLAVELAKIASPVIFEGADIRSRMSPAPGFTAADRVAVCAKAGEVAAAAAAEGATPICALISPTRLCRAAAFAEMAPYRPFVIWRSTSLETCQQVDPHGLYVQERDGKLENVSTKFDVPVAYDFAVDWYPEQVDKNITIAVRAILNHPRVQQELVRHTAP
jgi:adenylylsulfate kinase-like enzyme